MTCASGGCITDILGRLVDCEKSLSYPREQAARAESAAVEAGSSFTFCVSVSREVHVSDLTWHNQGLCSFRVRLLRSLTFSQSEGDMYALTLDSATR